jgi:tryptophan synthase alpha chain
MPAAGDIQVERLPNGTFRARCALFPDCEAVADSADAARQAVAQAVADLLRQQGKTPNSSLNPIDALFCRLRVQGRKAFIPFVTAGDPDLATTARLVRLLADCGAGPIEIGFPYSDPIADGPVIQSSYTRALQRHLHMDDIFHCVRQLPLAVPLVSMVSYSLVHHRGPERFLDEARAAGFSGAIVPDLPIEEAEGLADLAAARDFKLIQLVTPTTPPARALRIVQLATGFIYVVSVTGITGERDRLPESLLDQLRTLRQQTDLPLCVGFGVSKPEHVRMLRAHADGVIVGSALVRRMEQADKRPLDEILAEIQSLVQSLVAELNP